MGWKKGHDGTFGVMKRFIILTWLVPYTGAHI